MTDKTVSIYWFLILLIIASAIILIVYSLYGKPLDIRHMEGIFLAEKVADCVSRGGKIPEEILSGGGGFMINNENFLEKCHLNFEVEKIGNWKNDQFFVSLDFFDENQTIISSIYSGNPNLKTNSNINFIDDKTHQFSFCVERMIYSNGEDGKYYSIKIFTCVRKTEKNV